MLVAEAEQNRPTQESGPAAIVLSAKTAGALAAMKRRLLTRLEAGAAPSLGDIALTLETGRGLLMGSANAAWPQYSRKREDVVFAKRQGSHGA
jgi:acyl transferase domain-containing protein